MSSLDIVRIGCYSGFWGDSVAAAEQLIKVHPPLNYIVADYLAEVTMGILATRRKKTTNIGGAGVGGFVSEFSQFVLLPHLKEITRKGIKIITNAGGLDPIACKIAIEKECQKLGLPIPVIAAIYGDDLTNQVDILKNLQPYYPTNDVSEPEMIFKENKMLSLNAYFGAFPIATALQRGAHIVITGRCVDSALVLGPLIKEFSWGPNEYNKLASGSLAGHLVECGCQVTGGNMTDWRDSCDSDFGGWANMGYPIVEVDRNGEIIVTKPPKTGGIVNVSTVTEQMLYEVLNPKDYQLPDVIVDITRTTVKQVGPDRVAVSNTQGYAPSDKLKVSGTFMDGHRIEGQLLIGGEEAYLKAKNVGDAIIRRVSAINERLGFEKFTNIKYEVLGSEFIYGPNSRLQHTREVILRIAAHHPNPRALQMLAMEMAPAATTMAPAITGGGSGRSRPSPRMVHFSSLIDKRRVVIKASVGNNPEETFEWVTDGNLAKKSNISSHNKENTRQHFNNNTNMIFTPLISHCYGRSGDKGNCCNVALICRNPKHFAYLEKVLTPEFVHEQLRHYVEGEVVRYIVPGTSSFNFVITKCLGGGGLSSLNIDRQGKTYAQIVLGSRIPVPSSMTANNIQCQL